MENSTKSLKIANIETGETLAIQKATDKQIGVYLVDISYKRKRLQKIETAIKNYAKKERIEFDKDEDTSMFGVWKVTRFYAKRFDNKRFKKEATQEEIDIFNKIKEKYSVLAETIRFT